MKAGGSRLPPRRSPPRTVVRTRNVEVASKGEKDMAARNNANATTSRQRVTRPLTLSTNNSKGGSHRGGLDDEEEGEATPSSASRGGGDMRLSRVIGSSKSPPPREVTASSALLPGSAPLRTLSWQRCGVSSPPSSGGRLCCCGGAAVSKMCGTGGRMSPRSTQSAAGTAVSSPTMVAGDSITNSSTTTRRCRRCVPSACPTGRR